MEDRQDPNLVFDYRKRRLVLQKKKKYYQFITSLLLEEPLCIAWLTSTHDRLAEAGGRAPTARLVLGLAGQGATRPARQSSPVSLPSAATSAEGFSGGKEGWCVEGVYSPACRTRFSRGGTSPGSLPAVASPAVSPLVGSYSQFMRLPHEEFPSEWMPQG